MDGAQSHQQIRAAMRILCARSPGECWRKNGVFLDNLEALASGLETWFAGVRQVHPVAATAFTFGAHTVFVTGMGDEVPAENLLGLPRSY